MKRQYIYLILGLASSLFLTSMSQATTLRGLSLEQLAQRADCVVSGHIVARQSEQRGDIIYTVNRFVIDEVLLSKLAQRSTVASGTELLVAQLGGQLGDWKMPVAGTAPLQVGDRQILFLRRDKQRRHSFYIAGMSQGALKRLGDDRLLWAPTAVLLVDGHVQAPQARWINLSQLRAILGVQP